MFDFIKKDKNEIVDERIGKSGDEETTKNIAAGYAATGTAQVMTQKAASTFAKPSTYTGNRNLFDSGVAKANAKRELFSSGNIVKDPYTGDTLVLTQREAKSLYGPNWARHVVEIDHIVPIKKIFEKFKNNPWVTTDNIKDSTNSPDNLQGTSRQVNNAKRDRSNEEFIRDKKYLKEKHINITDKN